VHKLVWVLPVIVGVGACNSLVSSGINAVGPDAYSIVVSSNSSGSAMVRAEGAALAEAGDFCQRNGRQILVLTSGLDPKDDEIYRATFRCVLPGE
jgi:hypothetical protein